MQPQPVRGPLVQDLWRGLRIYAGEEAKTMSSRARMQPVGKSGRQSKRGFFFFLNQDGNSSNSVSHENRMGEGEAAIQHFGVQL